MIEEIVYCIIALMQPVNDSVWHQSLVQVYRADASGLGTFIKLMASWHELVEKHGFPTVETVAKGVAPLCDQPIITTCMLARALIDHARVSSLDMTLMKDMALLALGQYSEAEIQRLEQWRQRPEKNTWCEFAGWRRFTCPFQPYRHFYYNTGPGWMRTLHDPPHWVGPWRKKKSWQLVRLDDDYWDIDCYENEQTLTTRKTKPELWWGTTLLDVFVWLDVRLQEMESECAAGMTAIITLLLGTRSPASPLRKLCHNTRAMEPVYEFVCPIRQLRKCRQSHGVQVQCERALPSSNIGAHPLSAMSDIRNVRCHRQTSNVPCQRAMLRIGPHPSALRIILCGFKNDELNAVYVARPGARVLGCLTFWRLGTSHYFIFRRADGLGWAISTADKLMQIKSGSLYCWAHCRSNASVRIARKGATACWRENWNGVWTRVYPKHVVLSGTPDGEAEQFVSMCNGTADHCGKNSLLNEFTKLDRGAHLAVPYLVTA